MSFRFSLLIVLCVGLLATAATATAQQFRGALQVGVLTSTLRTDTEATYDPKVTFCGGVSFGYDFGNGFIVLPELLYFNKGAYTDAAIDGVPSRVRFDYTYLEVPLLVAYRFDTGRLQPRLFAGPSLAYRQAASLQYRARGTTATFNTGDDTVRDIDYGLIFGIGTDVEVGGQRLSLESRLLLGRSNIRDGEPETRNAGLALLAGFVF